MRLRWGLGVSLMASACFAEAPGPSDSATAGMTATTASTTDVATTDGGETSSDAATADTGTGAPSTTGTTTSGADTTAGSEGTGAPTDQVVQDFVVDLCTAQWTNGGGSELGCPVFPDGKGIVLGGVYPVSEAHPVTFAGTGEQFTDRAIVLVPPDLELGEVRGRFPGLEYHADDRFRTHAYCTSGDSCGVNLVIAYAGEGGEPIELHNWKVSAEDTEGVALDVVLSDDGFAVGAETQLFLIVRGGSVPTASRLLLHAPQIVRP